MNLLHYRLFRIVKSRHFNKDDAFSPFAPEVCISSVMPGGPLCLCFARSFLPTPRDGEKVVEEVGHCRTEAMFFRVPVRLLDAKIAVDSVNLRTSKLIAFHKLCKMRMVTDARKCSNRCKKM